MNTRLKEFIDYKTQGNQKEFGELLGWSPQYVHKLLRGVGLGIQAVANLLRMFPELNARWLITGEGQMLAPAAAAIIERMEHYAPYLTVMEPEERRLLRRGFHFAPADHYRWEQLLTFRAREELAVKHRKPAKRVSEDVKE